MSNVIIKGKITDAKTDQPIAAAVIFLAGSKEPSSTTNDNGEYEFSIQLNKDQKNITLVCAAKDYKKQTKVLPPKTDTVNFQLEQELAAVNQPEKHDSYNQTENCYSKINDTITGGSINMRLNKPLRSKNNKANLPPQINFLQYKKLLDNILNCKLGNLDNIKNNPCDKTTKQSVFADQSQKSSFLELSILSSAQAYNLIKYATDRYLRTMLEIQIPSAGVNINQAPIPANLNPKLVDYIISETDAIRTAYTNANGFSVGQPLTRCELIWSYWEEEGMLNQTMHAIAKRFQNIRNGYSDPLANLELDPLRSIGNILWGYIQDQPFWLTVQRRAYEYDHHYGIRLFGKAVSQFNPADSRSKFIEAFHNLLYKCTVYYKDADDMTRLADAFPVLNALREVHLLLAEGMHNQYSDLPINARSQMMIEQYILSRQEIWEFLRGRAMVLYDEPWMGAVDNMKTIQGWSRTSISYYHDLATCGEDILLAIRFTPWSRSDDTNAAAVWADDNRDIIQRYIYSYNVVTGVDLSVDAMYSNRDELQRKELITMPGVLIAQKNKEQKTSSRS